MPRLTSRRSTSTSPRSGSTNCGAGSSATRWPTEELVTDRSQGVQSATITALAKYWANDYDWRSVRSETERPATVHDRDRRRRDPLHPRPFPARGRVAADHVARLARLGHRAARDRRTVDRPDRPRRQGRGRVPPGAAVPPRLRLLERADRARLGCRPHCTRVGGVDGTVSATRATSPRAATSAPSSPT